MKIFSVPLCFWVLLWTLVSCQPDREELSVAFSTYIEQERLWEEAEYLFGEGQWELARKQYSRIFLVEREAEAMARQAACLLHRNREGEARQAMAASILAGAPREAFSSPVFGQVNTDSLYQELHPQYWETLDTTFRNELESLLQEQGAFSNRLRELVETGGWPDCWRVGCHDDLCLRLAQRIAQGNEADNRFFLSLMVDAAARNRGAWRDAQVLMRNLSTAYLEENHYRIKLWEIYLSSEGRLDREQSLLQLSTLAEIFQSQVLYLELYAPVFPGEKEPAAGVGVLEGVREQLTSLGLDPKLVGINPYPVPEKTDRTDFYPVGMTVAR